MRGAAIPRYETSARLGGSPEQYHGKALRCLWMLPNSSLPEWTGQSPSFCCSLKWRSTPNSAQTDSSLPTSCHFISRASSMSREFVRSHPMFDWQLGEHILCHSPSLQWMPRQKGSEHRPGVQKSWVTSIACHTPGLYNQVLSEQFSLAQKT